MKSARRPAVDAARALAIVAMVAYHFCFDLALFGLLHADFYNDAFWRTARTLILGAFMLLAGVSLQLSAAQPRFAQRFWKRLAQIGGCALLVSAGSYLVFPRSYIYFGVLHAIALSLLIARPLLRWPSITAVLGLAIVVAGNTLAHPAFDARALNWLGFTTRKPPTEDFVPLFPWLGVLLIGCALGARVQSPGPRLARLARLDALVPRALARIGQHSLAIYMLHQPLLIGGLWLFVRR